MATLSPTAGGTSRLIGQIRRNTAQTQQALERLTTGKRINRPADDPSGFVAAEELRSEIVRLSAELKTIGRLRTGRRLEQSGLGAIHDRLVELRGQVSEAAGSLLTDDQRAAFFNDIAESLQAVDGIRRQVGAIAARHGGHPAPRHANATAPGDRQERTLEQLAVVVDTQLRATSSSRASLGASERYEFDIPQAILEDSIVHHREALSVIEDADFAAEASNLVLAQTRGAASLLALGVQTSRYVEQIQELIAAAGETLDEIA